MKVCICSDSHGNVTGLQEMLDLERPQALLFLGDGERDFRDVDIPSGTVMYAVAGNCDFMSMEPPWRKIQLEGVKIFLTHGHFYGVKSGPERLLERAVEEEVQLVVHGHTHRVDLQCENGVTLLCPGSLGVQTGCYAVAEIKSGVFDIELKEL